MKYFVKTPLIFQKLMPAVAFRIPNDENKVFLSFDDGPHPLTTTKVLDVLSSHNIKATFFCLGSQIVKYPDLYQKITTAGHAVGNHSMHHLSGWRTKTDDYIKDVVKCDKLVEGKLFRPPYGKMRYSQYTALRKTKDIVLWDVMPGDFDPKISKELCHERISVHTQSGSIIVLHENEKSAPKLEYILVNSIQSLKEQGFNFDKIR